MVGVEGWERRRKMVRKQGGEGEQYKGEERGEDGGMKRGRRRRRKRLNYFNISC